MKFYASIAAEVQRRRYMFLLCSFVCLSVCLSVSKINVYKLVKFFIVLCCLFSCYRLYW